MAFNNQHDKLIMLSSIAFDVKANFNMHCICLSGIIVTVNYTDIAAMMIFALWM